MGRPKSPTDRRHFTEAARAAALAARRRKQELAIPLDAAEVFVVRSASCPGRYGWEIRRFGALVLDRGPSAFACPDEARAAGLAALERLPDQVAPPGRERAPTRRLEHRFPARTGAVRAGDASGAPARPAGP